MVKYLAHLPTFQVVFFRGLGTLAITSGLLYHKKIPFLGNNRILLITRAFLGLTAMSLYFMSLKELPVGTAVSLRYVSPIFAAIFAVFLLKEKLRPIQLFFFAMAFGGVLFLKGFDPNINLKGFILISFAALFSGLVYVSLRKIGKSEHPLVVVNYFMFITVLVGGILSIFNWQAPTPKEWLILLSLGFFGYIGQIFMTKAFHWAQTNLVAPLKYLEVAFTMCVGVLFFGDEYTLLSFIGLFFIVTALVLNTLIRKK